jgi:phage virion morphogenesis protein
MSGIRIEGDLSSFIKVLKDIESFDRKGLNEVIGDILVSSSRQRFKDEEDPQGEKWKTSIRAMEEGGQTLSKSSDLKNSINSKATSEGLAVGTNKIYAGTHQLGGKFTIRAKNHKYLTFKYYGRWIRKTQVKINMPARPFLGVSDKDNVEIKAAIDDFIKEFV